MYKINLRTLLLFSFVAFNLILSAQALTGTITVGAGKTYTTLGAAISALNTNGVGAGGVIFDVDAGHAETVSVSGGYSITTLTSTAANRIVFRRAGVGANPLITASGSNATGAYDAVIKVIGTDYVTFDGIDVRENPANTAGSTNTEFGYAFFYATTTNGCTNDTVQNCNITMNNLSSGTQVGAIGIYANTNHSSTGTSTAISTAAGCHNNHAYYGNTIRNCYYGIAHVGNGTNYNDKTDVGGNGYATGNKIINFGNTALSTTPSGVPGTSSAGIMVSNCTNTNMSYNTVSGNSAVNIYGMYLRNTGTAPTSVHTSNIRYNVVSDTCTSTSSSYQHIGIWNEMGGSSHTVNINNNKIINAVTTSSSFAGGVIGIQSNAAAATLNINNDTIRDFTVAGNVLPTTTAARSAAIKVTNTPTVAVNIGSNEIRNLRFNNSGAGDIVVFDVNGNYSATLQISANVVDTVLAAGTGSITGYSNTGSPSGSCTVSGNTFRNVYVNGGGSSSWVRFFHSFTVASQVISVSGNTIYGLGVNGGVSSSGVTGVYCQTSNSQSIFNNSIKNIYSGATNIGIQTSGGSGPHNVYGNVVDSLYSNNSSAVNHYGIDVAPSSGTANIYRNVITNISSGTSTNAFVYGLRAGSGTTANIYNNIIADLKAPAVSNSTAHVIRGISAGTPTNANVYNNTVYLSGTTSGTDFSTAALAFAGTTNTDVRNNILVNNCTPKGTGFSAAIGRIAVGAQGTVPSTFLTTSNNNCLFAPILPNGVIFVEGSATSNFVNAIPANCFDLTAYKAFMTGGRETASFSEIPPFISITAGSMNLRLTSGANSACFNGGQTISSPVGVDVDGTSRPIGSAYEVGAHEEAGNNVDKTPPAISYSKLPDIGCAAAVTLTATISDANGIATGSNQPRLYYKKGISQDAITAIATLNNNSVGGWKYVTPTSVSGSNYTFSFDYTLLPGGFVAGDSLFYFVAAQDPSGNVATQNAAVTPCPTTVQFTSAQSTSATPVSNSFVLKRTLKGAYTVGATGGGVVTFPASGFNNFATLTNSNGLFDAINKGLVSGDITATVSGDITETGTVLLNEWAEYDDVLCTPISTPAFYLTIKDDGSVRTLSAANLSYNSTTLPAMITLNGADRVRFNGGTGAQRNLVFRSTNTATLSCVPVFQLGTGNGCNQVRFNNCDIQTNGTSGAAPISAGIYIVSGNTNNADSVLNCDIHDATAGTTGNPRHGIYADGNTGLTNMVIANNNIYNIHSNGIQLGTSGNATGNGHQIIANHFYLNNSNTINTSYNAIVINGGTTSSGYTVALNMIGGQAPFCGVAGSPYTTATIASFNGVSVFAGTGAQSRIDSNSIRNINLTNTSAAAFIGIQYTGLTSCLADTVGHASNNNLGININAVSATGATSNYGIIATSGGSATTTLIRKCIVRFMTHNTSSTGTSRLHAINISYPSNSTITVDSCVVSNLTSSMQGLGNLFATGNANSVSAICGIVSTTTSLANITINDNAVLFLNKITATSTNQPGVVGIAIDGNTTNNIFRNAISGLSNASPGSAANAGSIVGIRIASGSNNVYNNMISIVNGINTNAARPVGIWDQANSANIYFNSVHIGGSQTSGGTTGIFSSPYACVVSSGTHTLRNNIFNNVRTGGTLTGANNHYALAITTTFSGTFTSNYNNLYTASSASAYCLINTTSYTLAAWKGLSTPVATPDVNSQNVIPVFFNATVGDLRLDSATNCSLNNTGIALGSPYTSDIDGDVRNTGLAPTNGPDIGADEFNFNPSTRATIFSTPICVGGSLTVNVLTNAPSPSYNWSIPSGSASGSSTTINPVALANAGTYSVTVTDANNCTSKFDSVVVVNANPTTSVSPAIPSVCTAEDLVLNGNPSGGSTPYTHEWTGTGSASLNNTAIVNPTFNNATASIYTLTYTVTDNNNCSATSSVSVTVNPTPSAPTITANETSGTSNNDGSICNGAGVTLSSTSASAYQWSANAGSVTTQNTSTLSPASNTTYSVTITDGNGCQNSSSYTVTVNANPSLSPTASPSSICNGSSSTLQANATAGSGTITNYNWSTGLGNVAGGSVSPASNTNYTVTVTNSNNCSATGSTTVTVNTCGTNSWTGATSTAWHVNSNWSNGVVPAGTDDATIPNVTNKPVITTNAGIRNITIAASSSVTVANGGVLTLNGIMANSGAVTIQHDGNFLQGNSSSYGGTGTFTVEKTVSNLADGYRDISAPVSATVAQLADDFPIFGQNNVNCWYQYNPYPNVQVYDEAANNNLSTPTGNYYTGWISKTATTNVMAPMQGFAIRTYQGAPYTLDFTGTPNNGPYTRPIKLTPSGTPADDGWNFVGNPYPSNINWISAAALNPSISGAYYVFGTTSEYTGSWGTCNSVGACSGLPGITSTIASGQGFFVKALSNSNFTLNNTVRTATTANYYKGTVLDNEIRLYLHNQTNGDEILTYTDVNATDNEDNGLDAVKIPAGNTVYMSYKLNQKEYTINVINEITETTVLPLVLWAKDTGLYTLQTSELNVAGYTAYLKDAETNTLSPLSTTGTGIQIPLNGQQTYEGRYSIVFEKTQEPVGINTTTTANGIRIYSYSSKAVVEKATEQPATIVITNLLGQTIKEVTTTGKRTEIELGTGNEWYAVVKVKEAHQTKTGKVLIR